MTCLTRDEDESGVINTVFSVISAVIFHAH